ncbi:hypothetical protein GSI_04615 [Ganoderma sinense ZZ0214-1]|uniref:Uncharacterized protein n=1 Tax=Ganoderma sinense ZZ0214-1 TaxID=1077348 RepID=A0A2G8SHB5_9APHY|nr:hypothetical protein GSI_04615 [Ganoderma sinense ZZ0214-1]
MAERKFAEGKARADELERNRQRIRNTLQHICEDLGTQSQLLKTVFSDVMSQLGKQSNEYYLEACRHVHAEGSAVNQLALPNARHRFLSTSRAWKEREATLTDEYAKRMK